MKFTLYLRLKGADHENFAHQLLLVQYVHPCISALLVLTSRFQISAIFVGSLYFVSATALPSLITLHYKTRC